MATNGTYQYMYFVQSGLTDPEFDSPLLPDLRDGGVGPNAINPVVTGVGFQDANSTFSVGDTITLTITNPNNAGLSGNYTIEHVVQDVTGGLGLLVQSQSDGAQFFLTNALFTGSNDPFVDQLYTSTSSPADTMCFLSGTSILSPRGEIPVERLRPGDLVLTTNQQSVPIRWIGRNTVSRAFSDPLRFLPIRIKAGALSEKVPSRDLLISTDHALFVDGILIHAGALINDVSIVRERNVSSSFTYYHVEVDDHSLILAENTPAETFIDNVDRMRFDNWDEYQALYPEGQTIVEMSYPRAKSRRQVPQAIRTRLADRARALYGANFSSVA
jgi:hypothetical protein